MAVVQKSIQTCRSNCFIVIHKLSPSSKCLIACHNHRSGFIPYVYQLEENMGGDMTSDIKKKVIAMMDRIFPEYESLFSDMFGKTSRDLLKECTTPEEILSLDTTHLAEILRKSSKGRFKQEKAEELQKTARNSFAVLLSSQTNSLLVKQMIEQIELLESQISEIEKIIEQLYSKFEE